MSTEDHQKQTDFPEDAKAKFSLAENLHVYYQFPIVENLMFSLLEILKADAMRPKGEPKTFNPSDHIVYMFGIILRSMPEKIPELWKKYMYALPPPLVYGALWYSDCTEGKDRLKIESKCSDKQRASLATLYLAKNKPSRWYEADSTIPGNRTDALKSNSPNMLVGCFSPDAYIQRLEEIWAHWFVTGDTKYLDVIVLMMDDVNLRKCLAVSESGNEDSISTYYDKYLNIDKKANYDLIMMMGCIMYDKNISNFVKSRLF
uniref:Uncharacterized protein n=1 Tax=Clandestinovirus TaxID=2831644 RepID=A0A8F8KTK6_9VIRU|nr:hypothetical protein KOM_12_527 [Clandestinovirus]